MLPLVTYEMIRQIEEERRDRSLRRFRWRSTRTEPEVVADRVADVIELAFGTRCEMEEPIGA